ncbi:peptide/nickel transport system substrate-binding protein [Herbihabitans rhizosphaerae]|uniref:Peptide/nickel transport system substrate-binding protein n=1 Tax=Herbihabitans rhizosphaerae TaxID=1872711 RepID=A0A4Q7L5U9_9PSEU|nr:ABC transporter substrate-binding protein [Herbihabitans rhizosphaerae]RZS45029.1 peptide/nickel transport system substrate-binding protein [Herbihabitans rhizosphaerae]
MDGTSRRTFLRGGVALAVATPLIGACGQSAGQGAGGTLRAALVGSGAAETLNPFAGATTLDFVRALAVHGTLGRVDPTAEDGVRYDVLSAIESAPDNSGYTLRVRPDRRFTDGSKLTARDVLYSLNFITANAQTAYSRYATDLDLAKARIIDDLTLVLPAKRRVSDVRLMLCQPYVLIFKDGTREFTPATPSCGPFRVDTFEAGRGTVLRRNDSYPGTVHLDAIELRSIAAEDARANALRGGQVDYAHDLAPAQARTVQGDGRFDVQQSAPPDVTGLGVLLNMSRPPFHDPRVRLACKLAINRQAILDTALLGRGVLGNDLFAPGYPDSATTVPQREHDPERARLLLREAGATGVTVTLTTAPETPGLVPMCTQIAAQLSEVGLKVTLDERPPGGLYADYAAYGRFQMAATYSTPIPPLHYYETVGAAGNTFALGWSRPDVDQRVAAARELSGPARKQASEAVHRTLWEDNNVLLPVFKPVLNGHVRGLRGVRGGRLPSFAEASLR